MSIPLNNFEQHIDATILARGHSYYNTGRVDEPEELHDELFETTIWGSAGYKVRIQLMADQITQYSCTCPYDYGPICKHVVALIYHFRQEMDAGQKNGKSSKSKTVSQEIDELLSEVSHDDLIDFCRELALKDRKYRSKLTAAFAHINQNESKALYARQIRAILQAESDGQGFIGWHNVATAGNQVQELLNTAEKQAEKKRYESALFICFAAMEEMVKALEYVDDSNGDISGCIYRASEIIHTVASESLPEPVHKQLFDYCSSAFADGTFSDWDWELDMLNILAILYETDEEAEQVLALIETAQLSGYYREKAQHIQLQIIEDIQSKEEATAFIKQHMANPEIRTIAIQHSIEEKQYDNAIAIAKDGIKHDSKDKPGLVYNWYRHLLDIAQLQENKEKIIEYARLLFIHGNVEKQPYYEILKKEVASSRWPDFVEELITDIKQKNRWGDFSLVAQIYINEQWWERLFEWVTENPSLEIMERYQHHLAKNYATEIAAVYEQEICALLETHTGRKYYRKACRFIRKMKEMGKQNQAKRLVKKLKTDYPNRPAMFDELNKLTI